MIWVMEAADALAAGQTAPENYQPRTLAPSSVNSELMAYALEVAHQDPRRLTRLPVLVPILLQLRDPLPRQISVALDGASSVTVGSDADLDHAVQQTVAALTKVPAH